MLNSLKAKEISTIKIIEDRIMEAALKGDLQISLSEISKDAERILVKAGYTISTFTQGESYSYEISWDN